MVLVGVFSPSRRNHHFENGGWLTSRVLASWSCANWIWNALWDSGPWRDRLWGYLAKGVTPLVPWCTTETLRHCHFSEDRKSFANTGNSMTLTSVWWCFTQKKLNINWNHRVPYNSSERLVITNLCNLTTLKHKKSGQITISFMSSGDPVAACGIEPCCH